MPLPAGGQRPPPSTQANSATASLVAALPVDVRPWSMIDVAGHVARDLPEGACVNLGIGLPTLVARHVFASTEWLLHCENGMLGTGPPPPAGQEDPDLIDAGKGPVTILPGGCYFNHAEAFAMIRGGHVDVSVMGAFQVAVTGDLANWWLPGNKLPAVGGAMDLAVGARRVVVMMPHTTRVGAPKLVARCTYPLTASGVVRRVYTNLATVDVADGHFVVKEAAPGVTHAVFRDLTDGPVVWAE